MAPDLLSRASSVLAREVARMEDALAARAPRHPRAPHATERVPLVPCVAPVGAGSEALAELYVHNEEQTACEVTLYTTHLIADTGYEIPSLRVIISPRIAHLPAGGETRFEVRIAVPGQTPAGLYSGLIQASGCRYVKAVLSLEVL